MVKLLNGRALARAIRDMVGADDDLRCAVAFWGPSLARVARERGALVVLDISMRGTSQNALRALGAPEFEREPGNPKAKLLDGMHAKLYLSCARAIVSSANASRNALGDDGSAPVLEEAGVLIDREEDPSAYSDAVRLFGKYWRDAKPLTAKDFARAVKVSAMVAARDSAPDSKSRLSLLEALIADPQRFSSTVFIFGDMSLDDCEQQQADGAYGEAFEDDKGTGRRQLICASRDRKDDRRLRDTAFIIFYWFGSGPGLQAYHDIVRVDAGDGLIAFYGRKQWSAVRSRLGVSGTMTIAEYWKNDEARARSIAASDGDEVGNRFQIRASDALCAVLDGTLGEG